MTDTDTFAWTRDRFYDLPVLEWNNYFVSLSRGSTWWWDVDANYGDGPIVANGYAETEADAKKQAEQAIQAHLDSVIAAREAKEAAFIDLHRALVESARGTAPGRLKITFPTWLEGYSEGVEHALETLRASGPKARAFLDALNQAA